MKLDTYLCFNGDCEAAFNVYTAALGGRPGPIFRYAGSPMSDKVPENWQNKIMHGSIELPDRVLMGADSPPGTYEAPRGFTLSLQMKETEKAEQVFRILSEGGKVIMPLEKTFWAARFGVCIDRFGIPWQVNCEE